MKISILLPYKENFSPEYPGAVSLFVYETSKKSIYKKNITVYGSTKLKIARDSGFWYVLGKYMIRQIGWY